MKQTCQILILIALSFFLSCTSGQLPEQLLNEANAGDATAQCNVGKRYYKGGGVGKDYKKAAEWFTKAARQGHPKAQYNLGVMYDAGQGVQIDHKKAVEWYTKSAQQGYGEAQYNLGLMYANGEGVIEDYVEAYKWTLLAGMNGVDENDIAINKNGLKKRMTVGQITEGQNRAKEFSERGKRDKSHPDTSFADNAGSQIKAFGTGFFISSTGHFLTAAHVVEDASSVKVQWGLNEYPAKIVFVDETLDVAVLKVSGVQSPQPLPISSSSQVKTGDSVFTLGFPQVQLQGVEAKYTNGSISSLSGIGNDPKHFQISVPVQPGNSGGPLMDNSGNVVGLITSRLDEIATLKVTGSLPQNVNYALKGSFVLPLLESLPDIQLEESSKMDKSEAIQKTKDAVGLVVCYGSE